MGYDRDDSFLFNFDPNRFPFGSKSKGKLSPRSYPIQYERKWKSSFLSVHAESSLVYLTVLLSKQTNPFISVHIFAFSSFIFRARNGGHPETITDLCIIRANDELRYIQMGTTHRTLKLNTMQWNTYYETLSTWNIVENLYHINDTFKLVIALLVNWQIFKDVLFLSSLEYLW